MVVTGVRIFVDPKAVMYLVGCRMDFVVSLDALSSLGCRSLEGSAFRTTGVDG